MMRSIRVARVIGIVLCTTLLLGACRKGQDDRSKSKAGTSADNAISEVEAVNDANDVFDRIDAHENKNGILQELSEKGFVIREKENPNFFSKFKGQVIRSESGNPVSQFEIAYKPGSLTGRDAWETKTNEATIATGGLLATTLTYTPGPPDSWTKVESDGEFKLTVYDKMETITIFVRTDDSFVASMELTGLQAGRIVEGLSISVP